MLFCFKDFFNSPLTALFLHSSLTAARRLRRGLTVLSLHHRFCKFKDSSELQNYVFEGSFCSTDFFSEIQGQQRITKLRFWGFVLPNGIFFRIFKDSSELENFVFEGSFCRTDFFRTDLYFKLRIKHCSVHVCVSEDCFELLVWIFWTSFLKFSKMFKLQTAESLTTTSRMANFKNTEGEKKSNDDDTFYISRDKCLRHSCAYFFGGQPCIIWPKQPKDPKKQHHLALTWCLVF